MINYFKVWLIYTLLSILAGCIAAFIVGFIGGFIIAVTKVISVEQAGIYFTILGGITGLVVSFFVFKWSIKRYVVIPLTQANALPPSYLD